MNQTKRTLALLLALLMALTACNTGGKPREIHKVDWVTSPGYLAEETALPVQTGDLAGCCTDGEYIYTLVYEQGEDQPRPVLGRVRISDGTAEILEQYEPPQAEDAYANNLGPIVGPDGTLWVYEVWTAMYFDLPEDFDPEKSDRSKYYTGQDDFHHLRQLDPATGKQENLIDIGEAAVVLNIENFFDVTGLAVDGEGNAYLASNGGVAAVDGGGRLLFSLEADIPFRLDYNSAGGTLAVLPDGTVAVLTLQPGGARKVRTIDPAAKNWGEVRYEIPGTADLIYSGTGGFLFFYTQDRELYAWEPEAGEPRRLLSWNSMDLEGVVMCFAPLDGGKLAALTFQSAPWTDSDSFYNSKLRLYLLSPSGKDPNAGKTRLVYGAMFSLNDTELRAKIDKFNKESDRWLIELRDYAGENTDIFGMTLEEFRPVSDAAMQRLRADVAAGNAPDIWDSSLDLEIFARQGCLEDLWPWIDGDEELGGREALMSHALECASVDGKLYAVSNFFSISTAIARADVVGERMGWTLEEMLECWRQLPEGGTILSPYYDGYDLLRYLIQIDNGHWVDWSGGTCHFDTQEFRDLLELCRQVQQNHDPDASFYNNAYTDLRDRKYLIERVTLSDVGGLLQNDALCSGPEHVMDYEAYLNENNIYSSRTDEDGNRRDKDAVICNALATMEQILERGAVVEGVWPLAADAAVGVLEGGGYASYVGMPSQSGSGSAITLYGNIGMSSSCRDKEGAWAFLRQLLLPGSTDQGFQHGFPINKADFDQLFAEPQWFKNTQGEYLLDADGNRIEEPQMAQVFVPMMDNVPVAMLLYVLAPNEAQRETFWKLYESIGPSQWMDLDLRDIIEEQAGAYFAGDKTLDETVDLIQRRASLYVNENR